MKNVLVTLLLGASAANAFVAPNAFRAATVSAEQSATSLGPKFLKDLGFEKPSWLPDFGGGEEEAAAEPVAEAAAEDDAEEAAEAAEEEETTAAP